MVSRPFGERVGRGREVGLVDRDPAAAGADQRPRFLGELVDLGGGELDVVEHRRPAHVGELVGADRGLVRRRRRTPAATAWLGARDSSGTRTSKPAAASRGPVSAISSHASSWLRIDLRRGGAARTAAARAACARAVPARLRGRGVRSRRRRSPARSAIELRLAVPATNTARCHAPPSSGGSSRTISGACSPVTERAQLLERVSTISPATRTGASNALPSSRARNASVTSLRGAHAGRRRGHLEPARAVAADRVDHAGERGAGERAGVDLAVERARRCPASRRPSRRGGRRRRARASSAPSTSRSTRARCRCRALRCRSSGTIAPRAVSSTAQIATRPSQRTLGPMLVADLTGAGGDQPAEHLADRDRQRVGGAARREAARPCARSTPLRRARGARATSLTCARSATGARGPPAQATTRPGSHETCSCGRAGRRPAPPRRLATSARPLAARRRGRADSVAARRRSRSFDVGRVRGGEPPRSDSRSATTWSRSSPRQRARAREVLLGVAEQRDERRAPRDRVRPRAPRAARASRRRRPRRRRTCRTATARGLRRRSTGSSTSPSGATVSRCPCDTDVRPEVVVGAHRCDQASPLVCWRGLGERPRRSAAGNRRFRDRRSRRQRRSSFRMDTNARENAGPCVWMRRRNDRYPPV